VLRGLIALIAGLGILVGAGIGVDKGFGLVVVERIPGEPLPEPLATTQLALILALHLVFAAVAGASAALVAPRDHKMVYAAAVAFVASLWAASTAVFTQAGPTWYHALQLSAVLVGPVLGAHLLIRSAIHVNAGRPAPTP
jgi:hypothetical protein